MDALFISAHRCCRYNGNRYGAAPSTSNTHRLGRHAELPTSGHAVVFGGPHVCRLVMVPYLKHNGQHFLLITVQRLRPLDTQLLCGHASRKSWPGPSLLLFLFPQVFIGRLAMVGFLATCAFEIWGPGHPGPIAQV